MRADETYVNALRLKDHFDNKPMVVAFDFERKPTIAEVSCVRNNFDSNNY